ncbi:polysaccharide pyruvyl transferase family protein [Lacinutrix sp. Hel_I_90]|uniref:polysaccharide pyruvyl transferase family protein n=1 Tax=Lacinutrix sp. Hel_I_90 TaxID=1249999 RepID=UPI0018CDC4FE|nr:polysaccharide pyruvyl transferase family protein [Lacinutrix sp. Hel_I_90]
MRKIYFLSASDRLNYGDLLFPILFKKVLVEKKVAHKFLNYGLINSNLSSFNALKTESYKSLFNSIRKEQNPILIIGGGEALFPRFTTLYSYINRFFDFLMRRYTLKRIERNYSISSRIITSKKIVYPFTPTKSTFKNNQLKIFYNTVGGTFNTISTKDKAQLISALNDSDYVSVRDNRSLKSMHENKVEASLFPDSALIMSNYFSLNYLKNNCSKAFESLPESYFMVQIGQSKMPNDFDLFFQNLLTYSISSNCKIVLCPIGLASGHNDYEVLKKIHKVYPETILVYPKNIEDIMITISKSNCYLGTSLHGLITAQSFNVPFYLFNKNVTKLKSYINTWLEEFCFKDEYSLEYILNNWNTELYKSKTDKQKALVYKNYDIMFSKF